MVKDAEKSSKTARPVGKPFAKGTTGNPGGRPKRTEQELDLIAACKAKTPQALDTMVEIMQNGEVEKNRLAAAQAIIERAYGKPVQPNELSGNIGLVVNLVRFADKAK